jgi:hypothetical protein
MAVSYTLAQNGDQQWVVSVHGAQIMICARNPDALKAAGKPPGSCGRDREMGRADPSARPVDGLSIGLGSLFRQPWRECHSLAKPWMIGFAHAAPWFGAGSVAAGRGLP